MKLAKVPTKFLQSDIKRHPLIGVPVAIFAASWLVFVAASVISGVCSLSNQGIVYLAGATQELWLTQPEVKPQREVQQKVIAKSSDVFELDEIAISSHCANERYYQMVEEDKKRDAKRWAPRSLKSKTASVAKVEKKVSTPQCPPEAFSIQNPPAGSPVFDSAGNLLDDGKISDISSALLEVAVASLESMNYGSENYSSPYLVAHRHVNNRSNYRKVANNDRYRAQVNSKNKSRNK